MAFNKESFCSEIWSQIEIDAEGDFKICCLANFDDDFGMALDKDNKVMNIMTHSLEEALNSETHKQHRLLLKDNIKPKRCRSCYDSEDATRGNTVNGRIAVDGLSKRQRVNGTTHIIPEYVTVDTADQYTASDGTVTSKIINLDIRFGNLCNQKCIMCSPQHSSQWYDDWIAISKYDKDHNKNKYYRKGKFKIYPL
jgi:glutamate-1-semialdehyde 2,1-aminomutase